MLWQIMANVVWFDLMMNFYSDSLREAQAVLLRKTLSQGGSGDKMAALLMQHIEKERKRLSSSSSSSSATTSVKSFHTQRGRYTVHISAPTGQFMNHTHTRQRLVSFMLAC